MAKLILVAACFLGGALAAPNDRIISGNVAVIGQFPHQVSLRMYGSHFCGGAIINKDTVLTSSVCSFNLPEETTVVAGSNSIVSGGKVHKIVKAITHPKFDFATTLHDIGIVKVDPPFEFTKFVQPVNLTNDVLEDGAQVTASGWGFTILSGPPSKNLRFVKLQALNLETCKEQLKNSGKTVDESNVCTAGSHKGTCQGDNGGALLNYNKEQVGIVTWQINCASGYPDVYTNVLHYKSWIEENSK